MRRTFNLADLFEGAAEALPDQDALVAGGRDVPTQRRSYTELDARARRVSEEPATAPALRRAWAVRRLPLEGRLAASREPETAAKLTLDGKTTRFQFDPRHVRI